MKYYLLKGGIVVGEAIVLSNDIVNYHLWENLRSTKTTTLELLKKKYKLTNSRN